MCDGFRQSQDAFNAKTQAIEAKRRAQLKSILEKHQAKSETDAKSQAAPDAHKDTGELPNGSIESASIKQAAVREDTNPGTGTISPTVVSKTAKSPARSPAKSPASTYSDDAFDETYGDDDFSADDDESDHGVNDRGDGDDAHAIDGGSESQSNAKETDGDNADESAADCTAEGVDDSDIAVSAPKDKERSAAAEWARKLAAKEEEANSRPVSAVDVSSRKESPDSTTVKGVGTADVTDESAGPVEEHSRVSKAHVGASPPSTGGSSESSSQEQGVHTRDGSTNDPSGSSTVEDAKGGTANRTDPVGEAITGLEAALTTFMDGAMDLAEFSAQVEDVRIEAAHLNDSELTALVQQANELVEAANDEQAGSGKTVTAAEARTDRDESSDDDEYDEYDDDDYSFSDDSHDSGAGDNTGNEEGQAKEIKKAEDELAGLKQQLAEQEKEGAEALAAEIGTVGVA